MKDIQPFYMDEYIIKGEDLFPIQEKEKEHNAVVHRSIVAITFLNNYKKQAVGSGVLISKNLVLTAAHNIYNKEKGYANTDFKVFLDADGTAEDYYDVQGFRFMDEFKTKNNKLPYDYALLKLKKSVQHNQFLKLFQVCSTCLMQKNKETCLQIYGFPSCELNYKNLDKYGNKFYLKQYGLARTNRIVKIDTSRHSISYGISTLGGQSGCPVVVKNQIIAIHVGGVKQGEQSYNVGRLVDCPLLYNLQNWYHQLKGDTFQIYKEDCSHKLYLSNKKLKEITVNEYNILTHLDLESNQLSTIDVSENINLTQLYLGNNLFSAIDVNENINLTHLYLGDNQLSAIDVSKNINLTHLDLVMNQLSTINISNNISLTHLYLESNQISVIDINKNIHLAHLDLGINKFSTIDVSKNIHLTHLDLGNNQLSAIDVNKNINLTKLYLGNNLLPKIDVSENISLTHLYLESNQISAIDVSKNINLIHLYLGQNQLTEINVSQNINLAQLYLSNNQLAKLFLQLFAHVQADHYLYGFKFSHQRSHVFEIHISCSSKDYAKCNELKEKWTQKYQKNSKFINRHGCKYLFTALKK